MHLRSMIIRASLLWISVANLCAVAQKPSLAFDVASIKPNRSADRSSAVIPRPGGLSATNVTVMQLMRNAFQIQEFQVSGQPAWFNSDRYDLEAKAPSNVVAEQPQAESWREMLQVLLADRFKLTFHREEKAMTVYELQVEKNGHKMTPASLENCSPPPNGFCGVFRASSNEIIGDQVSMDAFAARLSRSLGQTVVNRTSLDGVFNLLVRWTPDQNVPLGPGASAGPAIFAAIQEQVGLRLEGRRGPVVVLVVDHVERPAEN